MLTITAPLCEAANPGDDAVVALADRFDVHAVARFVEQVRLLSVDDRPVRIDGRAVRHIDADGIDVLTDVCGELTSRGRSVLLQPSTAVRVAFELVGRPLPAPTPEAMGVLA
jgi:anti-anti-sigma regulatory factor